jgi:hypothetical protein
MGNRSEREKYSIKLPFLLISCDIEMGVSVINQSLSDWRVRESDRSFRAKSPFIPRKCIARGIKAGTEENESLKCRNDDKYDFDVINSTTKVHFAMVKDSLHLSPTF